MTYSTVSVFSCVEKFATIEEKRRAKEKEKSWDLLKTSIKFLEENAAGWRVRRLKEVDRVKEEEKEDKRAILESSVRLQCRGEGGRRRQREEKREGGTDNFVKVLY